MVFLSRASSDRKVCRMCPANFCWCLAESSDLAWHFVQQGSLHIKCLTTKTRMTTDICQSLTGKNVRQRAKMSDRAPSEHFVWNTRNNFCDYCSSEVEDINMIGTAVSRIRKHRQWNFPPICGFWRIFGHPWDQSKSGETSERLYRGGYLRNYLTYKNGSPI